MAAATRTWLQRAAVDDDYTSWMEAATRDVSGIDWIISASEPELEPLFVWPPIGT